MTAHLLFDRNTFLTRFGASTPSHRALMRFHALVTVDESWRTGNAIEWMEDLAGWIFEGGQVPGQEARESEIDARARIFFTAAEEIEPFAEALKSTMVRILVGSSSTLLFSDTGIPTHPGFWRELVDRFSKNVLPPPPAGRDLSRFLGRLIDSSTKVNWLLGLPEPTRAKLRALLGLDTEAVKRAIEPGLKDAALLLAARIAAQGVSDDLRKRMPSVSLGASPFLSLPERVQGILAGTSTPAALTSTIDAARAALREVTASLDGSGISVDLVFRLELLQALLTRLGQLTALLFGLSEQRELAQAQLERQILQGTVADRSLSALLQSSTKLLAKRVVERAGHSGEHYVTKTRSEQQRMLDAAAGGGALTALMVFTKFFIGFAHPPPFFDALLVGLNYAWGFVAMQLLHFALATKQPSMTAATLAGAIDAQRGEEQPDLGPLVDLVARASRTQFTALLGNVFVVVPFALFIAVGFEVAWGHHVLDSTYAEKIVRIHHPVFSVTVFSAVMTGVWLWVASLLAGAAENYFVLRELPGAIATNRFLRRRFGSARTTRISRFLTEQASGFGGNIGFGLLLGFMPMLFQMVGIPLEVRHVTFVTGQLAYAAVELGPAVFARSDFLWALSSIPMVGLINFAVSFTFAIVVALRARGLGVRSQMSLARAVFARFVKSPSEFFLAPEEPQVSSPTVARSS